MSAMQKERNKDDFNRSLLIITIMCLAWLLLGEECISFFTIGCLILIGLKILQNVCN